jgi:hypothetical protein
MEFSVGANLSHFDMDHILRTIRKKTWTPAYNAEHKPRDGAWVAEATGLAGLSSWPEGTRLVLRKERPHPGAQLRFTDIDGNRITGFLTNTAPGGPHRQLADLELRHRRHARVEDRIRAAKDTGLRNLPFHDTAQNRVWLEICALAADLIALHPTPRPDRSTSHRRTQRLRLRLFGVAGRLIRTGRRLTLKIPEDWPWTDAITTAHQRLAALAKT